jgi:predicted ATPase
VFQVLHAELSGDFPALRSLDAFPGNLPIQTTGFVGRAEQLTDVAAALHEARVVTITGVGGVGKTRLATQVAADVLPRYRDGAWLCELAPVGDADALIEAAASALGVQPHMGQSLDETLLDFLRSKELLLVLDNCEHLLDPVARLVDRVIHGAGRVTVLTTSREGLALAGERLIPLPSLDLANEAVLLFVERARDARPSFNPSEEAEAAVRQICSRLDGIPLAIELAAARVQAMTPTEIAARLDDQFRLLSSGRRTAVERHQTLRRAIDWSYDLLSDQERAAMQRLAVFAGGCTLDAAEAVVAGDGIDAFDVLDHLATLVRRSLVVADQDGDRTRYRLLETIRQYAQDRLEESGEADSTYRRHAEHHTRLAADAAPHLRGPDQLEWIARLAPEVDNLRVALLWSLDHDNVDLALTLVVSVCVNGIAIGYQALAWAELVVANPAVDTRPLGPALLAQAAWNAIMRGELDRAREYDGRRVDGEAALGLAPNPANFQAPATIALFSGEPEIGREHARAWVAAARAAGDGYETVQGLTMLSATLSGTGDIAGAVQVMEEAVAEATRLGNPSNLSFALMTYGLQLNAAEQPARAIPVLEEAVAVGIEVGNQQGVASALNGFASAQAQLGDHRAALVTFLDGLELQVRMGEQFTLDNTLYAIASCLAELGEFEASAMLDGCAEAVADFRPAVEPFAGMREASIDACSAALGSERHEELRARGAAMSHEEALALVREAARPLLE